MVDSLEGKALEFYFQHIASKIHLWTITKIILVMFTNCFPSQFIDQLRRKLSRITQGKQEVKDYVSELERLAFKFRDMTERQITIIFWNGLNCELRAQMVMLDIDQETDSLADIIAAAYKVERSINQQTVHLLE